jgi:AcrR family transcriptional regulator
LDNDRYHGRVVAVPAAPSTRTPTSRERLVAAAVDVFVEQGYESARLQDIARAAGLTTGAVYANFRGKAALLFEAIGSRAGAEVDALLEQAAGIEARDVLERLGAHLVNRPDAPASLLLDAVAAARRDDELAELLRGRLGARESHLAHLIDRAKDEGAIDATVGTAALARFCLTLAMGALVVRTLRVDPPDTDDWQALVHRLVDAVAAREEHT